MWYTLMVGYIYFPLSSKNYTLHINIRYYIVKKKKGKLKTWHPSLYVDFFFVLFAYKKYTMKIYNLILYRLYIGKYII